MIISPSSLDTPLENLLNNVNEGKIQLPDFQRSWTWDDSRIIGIISSISQGYPNGFLRGASEWSVTYLRLISDEQYVAQLQKYELKKECEGIVKYLSQLNELPAENVRQAIKELYTTIKEQ